MKDKDAFATYKGKCQWTEVMLCLKSHPIMSQGNLSEFQYVKFITYLRFRKDPFIIKWTYNCLQVLIVRLKILKIL